LEGLTKRRIAGSDTTSFSATCAVILLVNNPEKMKALLEEIDRSFPDKDELTTFAKTQDLPYLNGVISEALRLMPVVVSGTLQNHMPINF